MAEAPPTPAVAGASTAEEAPPAGEAPSAPAVAEAPPTPAVAGASTAEEAPSAQAVAEAPPAPGAGLNRWRY